MTLDTTRTQMWVDWPQHGDSPEVRDRVEVEGWAWSPAGAPNVTVTVADRVVPVSEGRLRPDVSEALGIGEHHGWVASVSTAGLPPGPLTVRVLAEGPDGVELEHHRQVTHVEVAPVRRPRHDESLLERMDPAASSGTLVHIEHLARYRWAAALVADRDVLDAACGTGYGSALLREAGARSVVGIDADAGAIVAAREQAKAGTRFAVGDLRELPVSDASVDVVVCFEAIEHIAAAEQPAVIVELARVLRPGGLLIISSPVADAVAVVNPHHEHELAPHELHGLLRGVFGQVELYTQTTAFASLVGDRPLAADVQGRAEPPPLRWTSGPLDVAYVLALASDGELPQPERTGTLGAGFDVAYAISKFSELHDELALLTGELDAMTTRAYRAELALQTQHEAGDKLRRDLDVVYRSRSWQLSQPLRDAALQWRRRRR